MKSPKVLFLLYILTLFSCINNIQLNKESAKKSTFVDSVKIKEKIDRDEYLEDSIKYASVKKFVVIKKEGTHKYGGITKIEYLSIHQLINNIIKQSKKEMWTDQELSKKIGIYKKGFKGGLLNLDIERGTIGHANMDYFTLILRDLNEQEIMRHTFDSDIAETPINNDYWWNLGSVNIPNKIQYPFYVYVIDGLTSDKFKFEVRPSN